MASPTRALTGTLCALREKVIDNCSQLSETNIPALKKEIDYASDLER